MKQWEQLSLQGNVQTRTSTLNFEGKAKGNVLSGVVYWFFLASLPLTHTYCTCISVLCCIVCVLSSFLACYEIALPIPCTTPPTDYWEGTRHHMPLYLGGKKNENRWGKSYLVGQWVEAAKFRSYFLFFLSWLFSSFIFFFSCWLFDELCCMKYLEYTPRS